jgi:hypothetical protein
MICERKERENEQFNIETAALFFKKTPRAEYLEWYEVINTFSNTGIPCRGIVIVSTQKCHVEIDDFT